MSNNMEAGFRVGAWDVYPQQNLLKSPEHTKTLEPKAMDLLVFLAGRQGEVMSRQLILDAVWRDVVVGDEVVSRAVSLLRMGLGDDQKNPHYLKTISKRGYCLIADVTVEPVSAASAAAAAENPAEPITHRTLPKLSFTIITVLALAIAYFAIDKFFLDPERDVALDDLSIAVLPFVDMSANGDQAHFGNGMAEELRNEFDRLDGLHVAPRTSINLVIDKEESVSAIAAALNVAHILEGSIRRDGDQIRITAKLFSIADDKTLWTDSYDRKLENIFAIQEEIATEVSGALGVRLDVGGVNAFRGAGTRNVEAYEEFHKAPRRFGSVEGMRRLKRAIELDPNYAAAWSWLSFQTVTQGWYAYPGENRENEEEAYALVLRAIELDPQLANANAQLGVMLQIRSDWIRSEEAHLKSLLLDLDRPNLNRYGGFLQRVGRSAAALEQYKRSEALATSASFSPQRPSVAIAQGRFADARDGWVISHDWVPNIGLDVIIELHVGGSEKIKAILATKDPSEISTIKLYAPVLKVFDSRETVLSTLRDAYADTDSRWPSKLTDIAFLAAYFGDEKLALQTIGEETRLGSGRAHALWYPLLADVRKSQGFKELVTELNLVAYWRASGWPDQCQPLGDKDFECF